VKRPKMKAKVVKISRDLPEWDIINLAAEMIAHGGIVAFPTDTTYGFGANIFCEPAIERLKKIKARRSNEPFVIIAPDTDWVGELAANLTVRHRQLVDAYWPGPLTIVFEASAAVPEYLVGREGTIALRVPGDTLTQSILRACGMPLAAPSANLKGREPATCAREVVRDFWDKIDLVLDGGSVESMTPSTIVAVRRHGLEILRSGRLVIGRARA